MLPGSAVATPKCHCVGKLREQLGELNVAAELTERDEWGRMGQARHCRARCLTCQCDTDICGFGARAFPMRQLLLLRRVLAKNRRRADLDGRSALACSMQILKEILT